MIIKVKTDATILMKFKWYEK